MKILDIPLFKTIYENSIRYIFYLILRDSNINLQINIGEMPIFMAARKGHLKKVRLLIDKGMDTKAWILTYLTTKEERQFLRLLTADT